MSLVLSGSLAQARTELMVGTTGLILVVTAFGVLSARQVREMR